MKRCVKIKEYLEIFGGHAMAAGFSANLEKLDMIVQGLHNVVNENLDEEFLTRFCYKKKR
jgi:single-stranded DNA-specific DHH superfamily exonuclease